MSSLLDTECPALCARLCLGSKAEPSSISQPSERSKHHRSCVTYCVFPWWMSLIFFFSAELCHFNSWEKVVASPSVQMGGNTAIGIPGTHEFFPPTFIQGILSDVIDGAAVQVCDHQPAKKNCPACRMQTGNKSLFGHCRVSAPNFSCSAAFLSVEDCFEWPLWCFLSCSKAMCF